MSFPIFPRRAAGAAVLVIPAALLCQNALRLQTLRLTSPAPKPQMHSQVAAARATDAGGQLVRYQLALDQVSMGHWLEARTVLEDSVKRFGDADEINLLLAYVLEHEGRTAQAREALTRLTPRSPLATAFLARLKAPQITSSATTVGSMRAAKINVARSPVADRRLARMEKMMVVLVNDARRQNGLGALEWDDDLGEIARAHSVEMREKEYFAHESPTAGLTEPFDRYVAGMSRTPHLVAENIYRYWGTRHELSDADVRAGHTALMNSPGHRANILHRDATRIGIGFAVNANGDLWITQMFDRP